jgi:hypothetical protein
MILWKIGTVQGELRRRRQKLKRRAIFSLH